MPQSVNYALLPTASAIDSTPALYALLYLTLAFLSFSAQKTSTNKSFGLSDEYFRVINRLRSAVPTGFAGCRFF
jgi:hypothetical protein